MQGMKHQTLAVLTRIFQPHLSKMIGANRPIALADWSKDPKRKPQNLLFHESLRGISPGIGGSNHGEKGWNDMTNDMRRPYRILCLDGGGVRGALTVALLSRILKHDPSFLDQVDMVAGTSAGGILSLLISAGYKPEEVEDIYR
jgi:hypothetical protein